MKIKEVNINKINNKENSVVYIYDGKTYELHIERSDIRQFSKWVEVDDERMGCYYDVEVVDGKFEFPKEELDELTTEEIYDLIQNLHSDDCLVDDMEYQAAA